MTRSRPYKNDDSAHVEQKNWTHTRQCFGYERHGNPEVVALINALVKGGYGAFTARPKRPWRGCWPARR